ncbi:MAG: DUF2334 domain-containing protein [Halobacteriota archaeon]
MLIALLLLTMLFTGLVNVSATAQTSSGFINSSTLTAASVNAPVTAAGVTSSITAKKYVVFRDDDVGFGNLSALEAVDQVHIEENVPVTLAIIPHPNPCGTGNELLQPQFAPVLNYLLSIVNNPLFEFAQHGYNHYDYTQDGPPSCSASTVGAGVPQVVGPAGPYYEVGEIPGLGAQLVGAARPSEFIGRSYADQYNAITQGRDDMIQALGVAPTTFIPPFDAGDQNTLKAATALGFTLYSTGPGDFNVNNAVLDGIMVQASASFGIGWANDTAWKTGMSSLTAQTDAALNSATAGESVVVAYHFWEFENPNSAVDPARIALFQQYIDHLKSRGDVLFTTLDGQPLMNPSPAPAVCAQNANSLDVFAQGTYHALWNKHWDSTAGWSCWEYLGGYLTSSPAATSPANGVIAVFVRGSDGALYSRQFSGGVWGSWKKIGGQLLAGTGPAAYNWGSAQTGVFVTGTNHALYQWTGSTGWVNLGGYLTSSPAATSPANGVIAVFVRGSDGALYKDTYAGGQWAWSKIGGQLLAGTGPAAYNWGSAQTGVFVTGTSHALYQWTGSTGWVNLGGYLTSSPAATSPANGVIDVFVRGGDNGLWQKAYNNGWYAWKSIGTM